MKRLNVGTDESRSPLTQNGITLIALIITIIVMLILVGVTINVALNGGLIEKARTAGEQTQREVDKEYLLSLIIDTVNNKGDFQITATSLTKDDWIVEQSENPDFLKCTSPKKEVFYVNIQSGEILNILPEPVNIWKTKYGLTSDNLVYNYEYSSTDSNFVLAFLSDGSFYGNSGSLTVEDAQSWYIEGKMIVDSDYMSFTEGSHSVKYVIGEGKIDLYVDEIQTATLYKTNNFRNSL